jgi:hypothetical protein
MLIYIPTYKRVGRQITLAALPKEWLSRTWLVVRPEEKDAHFFDGRPCKVVVCDKKGVPAARAAALVHAEQSREETAWFFDDDLRFSVRQPFWDFLLGDVKMQKADRFDINRGLERAERLIGPSLPMVGWDARGGNDRRPEEDLKYNCRVMRAFGVHITTLRQQVIDIAKYDFWEDFHVALSLIERGFPIANMMKITNDGVTNSAGGVSTYRNVEALRKCREAFCKEHPFAKPIEKQPKSWSVDGGETVPDLTIYWQKCAAHAAKLKKAKS